MEVIAITQQKGGTGKTTTAAAIGAGLMHRGARVLFVDLDPQGNLTYILKGDASKTNAMDILKTPSITTNAPQPLQCKGDQETGAIIPATPLLSGADATITGTGREFFLAAALLHLQTKYDYCIVDTPPALGILTVNALTAATRVIVPCLADIFSIQATGQMSEIIEGIRAKTNPKLQISGILITRYTGRQNITREITEVLETAAAAIGTRLFNTRIRESVSIREAQALNKDIFSYNPRSAGAEDYAALLNEFLDTDK